jgi:hypothetical protein
MCEFIKDTDCRIIRRNFTLGFCMRSIKFTKLYARMVEDETCHIIPDFSYTISFEYGRYGTHTYVLSMYGQ